MAKAKRGQKLKVFRTPIGFHDALVAAPSQKAALEAWGSDSNLFAQGVAEQVTDPELMKAALENPGQVVKMLRGTQAEQLAALGNRKAAKRPTRRQAEILPAKRVPKPSRAAIDKEEAALDKLKRRQGKQVDLLERQRKELERRLGELRRRHERERDEICERLEDEKAKYERALRRHERG